MKLLISKEWNKLYPENVDSDIHTTYGVIRKSDYNSKKNEALKTHKGTSLFIAEANFKDLFDNIKRGPQIINLKDASIIAAMMGLRESYRVGDAGGGSGALTCFLANIVGAKGKVYSYEKEPKWCKLIIDNANMFWLKNVEVVNTDIYDGIKEKELDCFNLDLPTPWLAIKTVESALKNGGVLTVYVPNTTQLTAMSEAAKTSSLVLIDTIEIIKREWEVDGAVCRPKFNMLGHTGFVMVYRKLDAGSEN